MKMGRVAIKSNTIEDVQQHIAQAINRFSLVNVIFISLLKTPNFWVIGPGVSSY
jgi:hypothetical protein